MFRFALPILFLALTAFSASSEAAICSTCPSIDRSGPFPAFVPTRFQGSQLWFSPTRSGEGWSFGEIPAPANGNPVGFAISYTYEQDGAPGWLLITGGMWRTATTVDEIIAGEPIATLQGDVLDGVGGGCPTCAWTEPDIGQRKYGDAEFVFSRPDRAYLTLDGQPAGETLIPIELAVSRPLPNIFAGRWTFTKHHVGTSLGVSYTERNFAEHGCEVAITAVANPFGAKAFVAAAGQQVRWVPPSSPDTTWFKIGSGITCLASQQQSNADFHIVFDPNTNEPIRAIGVVQLQPGEANVVVPDFTTYMDVFIQDANTLILRRYTNNRVGSNSIIQEFKLTRIPE